MAKFDIEFPDEFLQELKNMEIKLRKQLIEDILWSGAQAAFPIVKSYLGKSIGCGKSALGYGKRVSSAGQIKFGGIKSAKFIRSTGQLMNAFGISPVKEGGGKWNIKVGFAENRNDRKSNAMIANILEYGARRHNQPTRPWLRPAVKASEKIAIEKMTATFEKEFGNIK
ncbi:MAG: hypothetical protein LBK29_00095 [Oscillospiraceae bacterium]|jgi:hypothetical protein|nr:hypothetical protein [Oscillospiraceae bacterium]